MEYEDATIPCKEGCEHVRGQGKRGATIWCNRYRERLVVTEDSVAVAVEGCVIVNMPEAGEEGGGE